MIKGMIMTIRLKINDENLEYHGDPRASLLEVLRTSFRLTGSKSVCCEGFCGACTVRINGELVASCLQAVGVLEEADITTIEGVGSLEQINSIQRAFEEHDVVQCGMCFPGMVMTFTAFLEANPNPTRKELKAFMSGNFCRCTGYERIVDALLSITKKSKVT